MDEPLIAPLITWEESSDVYKPTTRPFHEFLNSVKLKSGDQPIPPPFVFFEDNAWKTMQEHAHHRLDCEQGGILAGEVFQDISGFYYLTIKAALSANGAESSPTHLRFNGESWDAICKKHTLRPQETFVGWFHTHPGLGVFMSGTDKRTQSLFFNQPWHVAIVIDPRTRTTGVFYGPDAIHLQPFYLFGANTNDTQEIVLPIQTSQ